jgi:hypothetical protein
MIRSWRWLRERLCRHVWMIYGGPWLEDQFPPAWFRECPLCGRREIARSLIDVTSSCGQCASQWFAGDRAPTIDTTSSSPARDLE